MDDEACPLDSSTKANLRLLIGLRNEIEHHIPAEADSFLASRFLSTCLNYEYWATELFGTAQSVGEMLSFSLQFRDFGLTDLDEAPSSSLPANVARYVTEFESLLSDDEVNSPRYAYSLLFTRKLTNARGQADRVIEFIAPGSELATQIDNQYWVQKEVERKKFRPSTIVAMMREDGFPRFGMQHHTSLWKEREAKATGKGFGTTVEGTWLWYEPWVSVVRRHCQSHAALYGPT